MPSPFPGMHPYLESPDWFPDLHDGLISSIKAGLQTSLPPGYYARTRQHFWLDLGHRPPIESDVDVLRSGSLVSVRRRRESGSGGVAVAEPVTIDPIVVGVHWMFGDPSHEPYLEVRRRQGNDDVVVAVFEILSPSNKTPGDHGRNLYVSKQQETLLSPAHLIEIDLLRGGTHATAVSLELARAKASSFDYHVCVHRSDQFNNFFVYPIKLESKLPVIAVPLLVGDPDVLLDLQAVFDRAYDEGPYDRAVRYDMATVEPALSPQLAEWVKGRLAAEQV
jgi:Protein of unknown function (DUF4058)